METSELIGISIIGSVVTFALLYYVVKAAVSAGTSDLHKELKILNQFKIREMKKEGVTDDELREDIENGKK